MKMKSLDLAINAARPLVRVGQFLFAMLAAASQAAASDNLLTNGDFAQTYQPVLSSNPLPTGWSNLGSTTDNAGVWNGELRFSTAGNHVTTHRYYVFQQFDAGAGGTFDLTFDFLLGNAYNGTAINGVKVAIDNWYVTASQAAFSKTYGSEGVASAWHRGQHVVLQLSPGLHTLYLGTIGASQQNDQATVRFDNVSLASAVPTPSYVIAASALPLAGGTVLGNGSYLPGNIASLSATSNAGYYFVNWTEGGVPVSSLATYAFNVAANRALTANFAPGFTVTATASFTPGGSVTGAGGYGTGGNVTLVATPTAGYQFTGWSEGGAVVSGSSGYSFSADANRTLIANFIPVVTISSGTPGTFGFAWPGTAIGWVLQESPDLSPASWVNSTLPVTIGGGQNQVSIANPTGSLFFRLAHP